MQYSTDIVISSLRLKSLRKLGKYRFLGLTLSWDHLGRDLGTDPLSLASSLSGYSQTVVDFISESGNLLQAQQHWQRSRSSLLVFFFFGDNPPKCPPFTSSQPPEYSSSTAPSAKSHERSFGKFLLFHQMISMGRDISDDLLPYMAPLRVEMAQSRNGNC